MSSQTDLMIDELLGILESLIAIYKNLKDVGIDKKNILITDDFKALQGILQKEEEFASAIRRLDERRIVLQEAIPGSPVSLSQLIGLLDDSRKERAISLSQELSQTMQSFRLINDVNSATIQHLKNFLNHKMNTLSGISTLPAYGENGNSSDFSRKANLFDRNI